MYRNVGPPQTSTSSEATFCPPTVSNPSSAGGVRCSRNVRLMLGMNWMPRVSAPISGEMKVSPALARKIVGLSFVSVSGLVGLLKEIGANAPARGRKRDVAKIRALLMPVPTRVSDVTPAEPLASPGKMPPKAPISVGGEVARFTADRNPARRCPT